MQFPVIYKDWKSGTKYAENMSKNKNQQTLLQMMSILSGWKHNIKSQFLSVNFWTNFN